MNKPINELLEEIKQSIPKGKKKKMSNDKDAYKLIAKEELKYKYCFEAIQEFSSQYSGIRKYATLGELQLRLTNKIGRQDDMRGATKIEQDDQLRPIK